MKKAVFGLMILVVFGVLFGCDNGTTDKGTAPTLTSVIVASSEADANAWTSASSFTKTATIYTGIDCSDPDGDVAEYIFALVIGGQEQSMKFPLIGPLPATFKGYFCFSNMVKDNNEYGEVWKVADGYIIKITLIDSKGNKSASIASNTFNITN
jgi:hypothetical protein